MFLGKGFAIMGVIVRCEEVDAGIYQYDYHVIRDVDTKGHGKEVQKVTGETTDSWKYSGQTGDKGDK